MTQQQATGTSAGSSEAKAWLLVLSGDQAGRKYLLKDDLTTIGRGTKNDIVISDPKTSRQHINLIQDGGMFWAVDAGSANGFYVNEGQTQKSQLHHNDIITIGLVRMAFQLADPPADAAPNLANRSTTLVESPSGSYAASQNQTTAAGGIQVPQVADESRLEKIDLREQQQIYFGRDPNLNQITLDNPQISRRHLQITHVGEVFSATDLGSTNGTFVNGQLISTVQLNDGDIITVGPYRFMFSNGLLYRSQDEESIRVDVVNVSRQINDKVKILHDVSLTILPREFVAIVGGSGTGKSTLLDAISGVRPATSGTILYNKSEFYSHMDMYRSSIGYVPQDDIVPGELSVYKALYYAGRLRLPSDTNQQELHERIMEVIDDLDLEGRENTTINLLSGGQRKRVSIGAELISQPRLFFLDEPTSGLDPGLESKMMGLLRRLADQGRTVVLITHATQNVHLCDQVLFLARGGYLAFYGSPKEALAYFGVTNFAEIYGKLDEEVSKVPPEEWAERFRQSHYYNENIQSRLQAIAGEASKYGMQLQLPNGETPSGQISTKAPQAAIPQVTFRKPQASLSTIQQFTLLTRRYVETITKDQRNLFILLLQSPILAAMMAVVFKRSDWNRVGGDYTAAKTVVFLLIIVAVWLGTSNSAREIVKEASIYRRERRIGLKLIPYVLSKLVVQTGIVMAQLIILTAIVWLSLGLGASLETIGYVYLTLILTGLGGITLGLLISAVNTNSDRAISFVPVVLIPQIIFSGAVIPFSKMGPVGEFISHFMVAKWGYGATGRILSLDAIQTNRLPFSGPPPEQAGALETLFNGSVVFDRERLQWYLIPTRPPEFTTDVYLQWGVLGLMITVGLGLIFYFQFRKDNSYTR